MRTAWRYVLMLAFAWCVASARAQTPALLPPPGRAVVLQPPQVVESAARSYTMAPTYEEYWASGGVYLLHPNFDRNPAFSISNAAGRATRVVEFTHQLETAPAIWLGQVSERGWGVRGRWFQLDADTTEIYTAAPGELVRGFTPLTNGQPALAGSASTFSNLAVRAADLQMTCSLDRGVWSHLFGVGVRYTFLSQEYRATLANAATRIDLSSEHNFDVWGPTLSLETKRRFGTTGFAVYGQGYGAVLLGTTRETFTAVNNGVAQARSERPTDVLPIAEFEVGIEYQRLWRNTQFFAQSGFVGQVWWGAGNAANLNPIAFNSASDNNLGLVGLSIRAGMRY